jgi:hypothetical protein
VMARTRNLGTHPEALEVVVAPLRGDGRSAGRLSDPASHCWAGPQPATWCWSLDGSRQLLLLLGRQERRRSGGTQLTPVIPEGTGSLGVIAMHHATRVVVVQANQPGRLFDGHAVVCDQGKELPAACLNRCWGLTSPLRQLRGRDMGLVGEASGHGPAYQLYLQRIPYNGSLLRKEERE